MKMTMALLLGLLLAGGMVRAGENLVPNGDFQAGKVTADNWEKPDGLSSFWVNDPVRGRILKLDSRIDQGQLRDWKAQLKQNPHAVPPKPVIPENRYAAAGGDEGVMLDSAFIPVQPGQNYKLSVDYKGAGKPFVWIKGFMPHPRRKVDVDAYQTRLEPQQPSEQEWRTFSIGFNPTARTPNVTKMKVRIYAYWPAGIYYFSNVRIEAITPAEMAELVKKRAEVSPAR